MRSTTSSEQVIGDASPGSSYGEAQSRSVDLNHLAEEVSRRLAKQIAVERERRGIKEWN
jgi:hypothetical protein